MRFPRGDYHVEISVPTFQRGDVRAEIFHVEISTSGFPGGNLFMEINT